MTAEAATVTMGTLTLFLLGASLLAVAIMKAADALDRIYKEREYARLERLYRYQKATDAEAPQVFWPESPTANYTDSFRDFYND